jgi:AcrR family transcriptional regulator
MTSVSTKPAYPRRAKGSEERRQRVLEAASACFTQSGFQKTSISQIAEAAGVSTGLIYFFFESKEALFGAVASATLNEWWQFTEEAAARHADDPVEELRALFTSTVVFVEQRPLLGSILEPTTRRWLLQLKGVSEANRGWEARLGEAVAKGIAAGRLRSDIDVPRTAAIIRQLQIALIARLLDSAHGGRPFSLGLVEGAIALLLDGVLGGN